MSKMQNRKRGFLSILAGLMMSGLVLADAVNINRADEKTLSALKGIGPAKAEAIVTYRQAHGPFKSVDQLAEIKGIGPKILEKLRPQVTLGDQ